jgi:hypothetical protein
MTIRGSSFALLVSAAASFGVAAAPAQEPGAASGPVSAEAAVDDFRSDKAAEQARAGAAFQARGRGADAAEIRNMLRAASLEKAKPFGIDERRSVALTESLAIDAADYLVSLGYKAVDVRTLAQAGFDPLGAAARLIRGTSSQMDRIVLAPYVVAGEVVDVRVEDLGDGFGSTVVFRPHEVLAAPQGANLRGDILIRQESGTSTGRGPVFYTSDFRGGEPGRHVLLLSDQRYEHVSAQKGKRGRGNGPGSTYMVRSAFDQLPLAGDGTRFASPLEDGTATVEALRTKVQAVRK